MNEEKEADRFKLQLIRLDENNYHVIGEGRLDRLSAKKLLSQGLVKGSEETRREARTVEEQSGKGRINESGWDGGRKVVLSGGMSLHLERTADTRGRHETAKE